MVPINPASDGHIMHLSIAFIILTFFAVATRFVVRAKSSVKFGADDAWIVVSLATFYTYISLVLYSCTHKYFGTSLLTHSIKTIQRLALTEFAAVPLFTTTIATSKISIIFLYRRIFIGTGFRRGSAIAIAGVAIFWFLSILLFVLIQCRPMSDAWIIISPRRHCISFAKVFLGLEIYNCILDLAILFLPLRELRILRVSLTKKIALGFIFFLGSLVFVVGIIHIVLCYKPNSPRFALMPNVITSTIENGLAILCACLPTFGPIISKLSPFLSKISSKLASQLSSRKKKSFASSSSGPEPSPITHGPPVLLEKASPSLPEIQTSFDPPEESYFGSIYEKAKDDHV